MAKIKPCVDWVRTLNLDDVAKVARRSKVLAIEANGLWGPIEGVNHCEVRLTITDGSILPGDLSVGKDKTLKWEGYRTPSAPPGPSQGDIAPPLAAGADASTGTATIYALAMTAYLVTAPGGAPHWSITDRIRTYDNLASCDKDRLILDDPQRHWGKLVCLKMTVPAWEPTR